MPLRSPQSPRRGNNSSPSRKPAARAIGAVALAVLGTAACGRSAPVDALDSTGGDPDIAGVSVTSADAIVAPQPTTAQESVSTTATSIVEETTQYATYVVEPGDTLSGIATSLGISVDALVEANGIVDVNSIAPGQQLVVPAKPVDVSVVDTNDTNDTPTTQP